MRPISLAGVLAASLMMSASLGLSQEAPTAGSYKVLKTAKIGGEGGYDYIFADVEGRRLYIPRGGTTGQLTVFNLDTLEPAARLLMSGPVALRSIPNPTTGSPPQSRSPCGTRPH